MQSPSQNSEHPFDVRGQVPGRTLLAACAWAALKLHCSTLGLCTEKDMKTGIELPSEEVSLRLLCA